MIIPNTKQNTQIQIIRQTIEPDSIVYTDGFLSYDALDVFEFRHHRINHSEKFVEARNHINGIENFWNQAKRHLRRFNGFQGSTFISSSKSVNGDSITGQPQDSLRSSWDGLNSISCELI